MMTDHVWKLGSTGTCHCHPERGGTWSLCCDMLSGGGRMWLRLNVTARQILSDRMERGAGRQAALCRPVCACPAGAAREFRGQDRCPPRLSPPPSFLKPRGKRVGAFLLDRGFGSECRAHDTKKLWLRRLWCCHPRLRQRTCCKCVQEWSRAWTGFPSSWL